MTIQSKLSAILVLFMMLIMSIFFTFFHFYESKELEKTISTAMEHNIEIQQNILDFSIHHYIEMLETVIERDQLKSTVHQYFLTQDSTHFDHLNHTLHDALNSVDEFEEIMILDTDGRLITSTKESTLKLDYSHEPFFIHSQNKKQVSPIFLNDNTAHSSLMLSGPLKLDGNLLGVILIKAHASDLYEVITTHSNSFINMRSHFFHFWPKSYYPDLIAGNAEGSIRLSDLELSQTMIKSLENHSSLKISKANNAQNVWIQLNNDVGWGVIFQSNYSTLKQEISGTHYQLYIFIGAILFLALYVVFFLYNRFKHQMSQIAKKIDHRHAKNEDSFFDEEEDFDNELSKGVIDIINALENKNLKMITASNHELQIAMQKLHESHEDIESMSVIVERELKVILRGLNHLISQLEKTINDDTEQTDKANDYLNHIKIKIDQIDRVLDTIVDYSHSCHDDRTLSDSINLMHLIEEMTPLLQPSYDTSIIIDDNLRHVILNRMPIEETMRNLLNCALSLVQTDNETIRVKVTDEDEHYIFKIKRYNIEHNSHDTLLTAEHHRVNAFLHNDPYCRGLLELTKLLIKDYQGNLEIMPNDKVNILFQFRWPKEVS